MIKQWIEQGAEFKGHWAYIMPGSGRRCRRSNEPGFVRNPIDRFVLAKLKEHELAPSPRGRPRHADPPAVLRPDRPAADAGGGATRSSTTSRRTPTRSSSTGCSPRPHYGERMAVYWLDLVRYADTIGYHSDNPRTSGPYRDYVINVVQRRTSRSTSSRSSSSPATCCPNATIEQKVASAYNRLLQTTEEGGAQAKEYDGEVRRRPRAQRRRRVWLGADDGLRRVPRPQVRPVHDEGLLQLAAFFADIQEAAVGRREPGMPVPTPEQEAELEAARRRDRRGSSRSSTTATPELAAAQAEWEKQQSAQATSTWTTLEPADAAKVARRVEAERGSRTASLQEPGDKVPAQRERTPITAKTDLKDITGFRLEALTTTSFPPSGPGTSPNGNFVLTEFKVDRRPASRSR